MTSRNKGDIVKVKTAIINNKEKLVFSDYDGDFQFKLFEIAARTKWHPDLPYYYIILIEDHMIGWTISKSHVQNNDVDEFHIGRKFYEISEDFIIKDAVNR
jgi:hypothetical protein